MFLILINIYCFSQNNKFNYEFLQQKCKKNANVIADYILLKGKIELENEKEKNLTQEESALWIYLRSDISFLYEIGFFDNEKVKKVKEINEDLSELIKKDIAGFVFNERPKTDDLKKDELKIEKVEVTKKRIIK